MSSFPKIEITQLNLLVMEQGNLPVRLSQLYVEVLTPDTYVPTTISASGSWPFWTPEFTSTQQIVLSNNRYKGVSESVKLNQVTKYNVTNLSNLEYTYNNILSNIDTDVIDFSVIQHSRFQILWRLT